MVLVKKLSKKAYLCILRNGLAIFIDIIAKAVELGNIRFFAEVNRKVVYIAILRIGRHPDFDAIFCWFCSHVFPNSKPAFKCNHSFVNREVLRGGLIGFLDIL